MAMRTGAMIMPLAFFVRSLTATLDRGRADMLAETRKEH
jgi:hypothetical protein